MFHSILSYTAMKRDLAKMHLNVSMRGDVVLLHIRGQGKTKFRRIKSRVWQAGNLRNRPNHMIHDGCPS